MNDPEKKKEKMKMSKKENMANPDKLGAKNLFLWSANGGSAAVQVVLLGNLSMYLTNALGMNVALVGTLLMASKAFDGTFFDSFLESGARPEKKMDYGSSGAGSGNHSGIFLVQSFFLFHLF